ncbi:MAG TPA: glutamine-hydrolyzing carbamoyl-phosphate synthase small subunit [Symbiobacteriaceae bacterium]
MKGYLVLEDGTYFAGTGFGAAGNAAGEVVFFTGMTGYQEVVTDPTYYGQIVLMTFPLIGNTGINPADLEARGPQIRGIIVKEICDRPSHWQSQQSLSAYLKEHGIPGLANIDTRALTRHLRDHGTMRAVLVATESEIPPTPDQVEEWAARARAAELHDQVRQVTTSQPYHLPGHGHRVVVVDCGVKRYILRALQERNCDLTVVPADTPAREILALEPDGVLVSSGPGNPMDIPATVETIRALLEVPDLPLCGIALGHELLALALGGRTYKLKFGHRGSNYPVKDLATNRVYITQQNHGYAVVEESLPADVVVTHRNLNDGTVEGIMHRHKPVFAVEYHPQAEPWLPKTEHLFDRFVGLMDRYHPVKLLA